jgi:hypothetical protein
LTLGLLSVAELIERCLDGNLSTDFGIVRNEQGCASEYRRSEADRDEVF